MSTLHLFEGYGVELEYVIVDTESLDIRPISDELIKAVAGHYSNDAETGKMGWSNEFVMHVLEMRNLEPVASLDSLPALFNGEIARANGILAGMNCRLMPGSMHPWMRPSEEARFWPHENRQIYQTYDRIFGCRTHGWANIQSMQLNLPFADDDEFRRLHAAIRLVLPIIPAIAASSPVAEGRLSGELDTRIIHYTGNQRRVPSIAGTIIPEPIRTIKDYHSIVLNRMYEEISPLDTEGILQHEWLNSRGAIPRFDRSAIEIRLPDIQECPSADIAVASAITSAVRMLVEERHASFDTQYSWPGEGLVEMLGSTAVHAENAVIENSGYLELFGMNIPNATAGELWRHIMNYTRPEASEEKVKRALDTILDNGTLSRRLVGILDTHPSKIALMEVYGALCRCLAEDRMFTG